VLAGPHVARAVAHVRRPRALPLVPRARFSVARPEPAQAARLDRGGCGPFLVRACSLEPAVTVSRWTLCVAGRKTCGKWFCSDHAAIDKCDC